MSVAIALEFFPAFVTLPSGAQLTPAKVYVVDGRVQVYILANGEPRLYFDRELVSHGGTPRSGLELQVPDGTVFAHKERGCGCGNPLKNFNPWPGERRSLVAL